MRLTREQIKAWRKHWNNASALDEDSVGAHSDELAELNTLCDLALLGLEAQEKNAAGQELPVGNGHLSAQFCAASDVTKAQREVSPPTQQPATAAPDAAPPALQMALGNHSIGVFKDGKLIAADFEVYAEPAAAALAVNEWVLKSAQEHLRKFEQDGQNCETCNMARELLRLHAALPAVVRDAARWQWAREDHLIWSGNYDFGVASPEDADAIADAEIDSARGAK